MQAGRSHVALLPLAGFAVYNFFLSLLPCGVSKKLSARLAKLPHKFQSLAQDSPAFTEGGKCEVKR